MGPRPVAAAQALSVAGEGYSSPWTRQGGAIAFNALIMLSVLVLFAAFAIDTARLVFAQRALQVQADLAALAVSRNACYVDGTSQAAALTAIATASLVGNGFDTEAGGVAVNFGEALVSDQHWHMGDGSSAYRPAAQVVISTPHRASLLAGGAWGEEVSLDAAATVFRQLNVGFGLGSGLLDVDLTNSVLGALLGGGLNVLSYQGIATADVSLAALLLEAEDAGLLDAAVSVGTVDEVLASDVALADLLQASVDALDSDTAADVDLGLAMAELIDVATLSGLSLSLGDLLQLASAADAGQEDAIQRAALASRINLYGLVSGAILAANRGNAVLVPGLAADLGIAGLAARLSVIEPPQYTFGLLPAAEDSSHRPRVETAQVSLDIKATLLGGGLTLGIISLDTGSVGVHVDVARATSSLLDAGGCSLDDAQVRLDFATHPSVANLRIGDGGTPGDPGDFGNPLQPLTLGAEVDLGLLDVPVQVGVQVTAPVAADDSVAHTVVLERQPLPYTRENISSGLGDTLDDTLGGLSIDVDLDVLGSTLLNGLLGSLLATLTSGLVPLVDSLVTDLVADLVEPLLRALGITVGYADLIVASVEFEGNGLID